MIDVFCIIAGLIFVGLANTYYWYRKSKQLFESSKREGLIPKDMTWEQFLDKMA